MKLNRVYVFCFATAAREAIRSTALGPAASSWCFFSLRTGAAVCCRFPHLLPGSLTLQHTFSFVYCLLAPGKQLSVSVPGVPTSPMLSCLPRLTAFKKRMLYPSTGVNSICYQHGITLSAQQHPAKELALTSLCILPICMQIHLAPLALVELACVSVWAQSHPSIWARSAPSVCSRNGAFVKQEQDSHIGKVIMQLLGLGLAF